MRIRILSASLFLAAFLVLLLSGCSSQRGDDSVSERSETAADTKANDMQEREEQNNYTGETKVADVISDPFFEDYGRLIFPVDQPIDEELELQDVDEILTWYNNVNPERTVEIVNYLKDQAESG